MTPIKVLVVDDSKMIRRILSQCLSEMPDIEVIGEAADPFEARDKIKELSPDVLTLDIDMPGMDGLSFLEKLMRLHPMPVVMVSKMTQEGAMPTIYALALGAVEAIGKPSINLEYGLENFTRELAEKIRIAAYAKVQRRVVTEMKPKLVASKPSKPPTQKQTRQPTPKIIGIGASTGGVETLCSIFSNLQGGLPPIVITQHMPPLFTASFARRLDGVSAISVCEASDGDVLLPGCAYVAPGNLHLLVRNTSGQLTCQLSDSAPVSGHRPSVDYMFRSIAETIGGASLGVILTGMGRDGASGLLAMQQAGATTIGQDEASCVVYGMPRAAAALGATSRALPIEEITTTLNMYAG